MHKTAAQLLRSRYTRLAINGSLTRASSEARSSD